MVRLRKTKDVGLNVLSLDMETAKLVLITDASFENSRGYKSQLGYIVLMKDSTGASNTIHYASARFNRVTRSVLAAEGHALVVGFDSSFIILEMLQEITGRTIDLEAFGDSKTLFDFVAKNGGTQEKCLRMDIYALKESYVQGE